MTLKLIIDQLDRLLKPLGFARKKRLWNRNVGSFIDVVEIQVSKSGGELTVNAGVVESDVYATLWGSVPAKFVEEPMSTIGVRIGELVDGKDKWWQTATPDIADELAHGIATQVLPFLEGMHTREAMKEWLISKDVTRWRYPLPIINLAILECLLGNAATGCALLKELQRVKPDAWSIRAADVAARLHCEQGN
jgi:hypothetical protein